MHHRSAVKGANPVSLNLQGDLLFEDIPIWLEGAVKGGVAPTQPDAAVDLFTFAPNYVTSNAQKTFTVEAGDNEQEIEVPYCIVESIELSWGVDEPVKCNVNLLGQRIIESTFTGSLASPTVETALGNKVQMFVDTAWSGIGGTQVVDGELVEGTIKINSGLVFVKRADGTLYPTKPIENRRRLVEAEFTVEHDAVSKAWRALYEANTKRFIEIRFVGSTIATTFTHFLKVQWGGPFRAFSMGEDGGVNTAVVRSVSEYDATGSAEAKFLAQVALDDNTMFD